MSDNLTRVLAHVEQSCENVQYLFILTIKYKLGVETLFMFLVDHVQKQFSLFTPEDEPMPLLI